jgi:hypothetical protein
LALTRLLEDRSSRLSSCPLDKSRHPGALQHERQRNEDDRCTDLVDENHFLSIRESKRR